MSSIFCEKAIKKYKTRQEARGEEQVGSISTGDLKRALSQIDRFERVESYDVTGGFVYEDSDGERANYGLDIAVYFKK